MKNADYETLVQACRDGDTDAWRVLGLRLMKGDRAPLRPQDGADLLANAAETGDPEALRHVAVLSAKGLHREQNWALALDCLQTAAENGSASARRQLALLTGEQKLAAQAFGTIPPTPDVWRRLRRAVDIEAWLNPPPKRIVLQSPRVRAVEGFLPRPLCDWIVARAKGRLRPARVYGREDGAAMLEEGRTNSEFAFELEDFDLVLAVAQARIAAAMSLPVAQFEPPNALHYKRGQAFSRHFDFLDPAAPALARDIAANGQRIATFLLYLNDDYEGGETQFPMVDLRHRGAAGDALYFANIDASGAPDRLTLHEGLPPTRGEKWLLSQFVRGPAG